MRLVYIYRTSPVVFSFFSSCFESVFREMGDGRAVVYNESGEFELTSGNDVTGKRDELLFRSVKWNVSCRVAKYFRRTLKLPRHRQDSETRRSRKVFGHSTQFRDVKSTDEAEESSTYYFLCWGSRRLNIFINQM